MDNRKESFKAESKAIVDGLFDAKLFKEGITRDDMNRVEDFIADMMSMRFEAQTRTQKLIERLDKHQKQKS